MEPFSFKVVHINPLNFGSLGMTFYETPLDMFAWLDSEKLAYLPAFV